MCLPADIEFAGHRGHLLRGRWWGPAGGPDRGAVVMLHGLSTHQGEFGEFPLLLCRRGLGVLTFDFSGHGRSQGPRGLLSQRSLEDDTEAALAAARRRVSGPLFLLGHSLGAYPALVALVRSPLAAGGILVAPQLRSGDSLSPPARGVLRLLGALYRGAPWLPGLRLRRAVSYHQIFASPRAGRRARELGVGAEPLDLRSLALLSRADNRRWAVRVERPLLVVACGGDRQVPLEGVRRLAELVPAGRARLVVLEGAGHSPFLEEDAAEALAREAARFCLAGG